MSRNSSSGRASRISVNASAPLAHSPATATPGCFSSKSRSLWRAGFSSSTMSALICSIPVGGLPGHLFTIGDDDLRDDPAAAPLADGERVGRGVELRQALLRVREADAGRLGELPAR